MNNKIKMLTILMLALALVLPLANAISTVQVSSTITDGLYISCQGVNDCVITDPRASGETFAYNGGAILDNLGSTPGGNEHDGVFIKNPVDPERYDMVYRAVSLSFGSDWYVYDSGNNNITNVLNFNQVALGGTNDQACVMTHEEHMACHFSSIMATYNTTLGDLVSTSILETLSFENVNKFHARVDYDGTNIFFAGSTVIQYFPYPSGSVTTLSQPSEDTLSQPMIAIADVGEMFVAQYNDTEVWYFDGVNYNLLGNIATGQNVISLNVIDETNGFAVLMTENRLYGISTTALTLLENLPITAIYGDCVDEQDTCLFGDEDHLYKVTDIESGILESTPANETTEDIEFTVVDTESITTEFTTDMAIADGQYLYIVSEDGSSNGLLHSIDILTSSLGTDEELHDFSTSFHPRYIDFYRDLSSNTRLVMGGDEGIAYIGQASSPAIVDLQTPTTASVFSPVGDVKILYTNDTHTIVGACGTTGTGLPGDPLNPDELVIIEIEDNGTAVIVTGIQPSVNTECLSLDYDSANNLLHVNTGKSGSGAELYELDATLDDFTSLDSASLHSSAYTNIYQGVTDVGTILYASTGKVKAYEVNLSGGASYELDYTCNSPSSTQDVYSSGDIVQALDTSRDFIVYSLTTDEPAFELEACELDGGTSSTAISVWSEICAGCQIVTMYPHPTRDSRILTLNQAGTVYMLELEIGEEEVTENQLPLISEITVSTTTPDINEPVTVLITATDPDGDDNLIRYALECEGVPASPTSSFTTGDNEFTCIYTTSGSKTIRAYVTDEQHPTTEFNFLDQSGITVSTTISNDDFLKFRVFELDTTTGIADLPVQNVNVTIDGYNTSLICDTPSCPLTDSNGFVQFRFVNGTNDTNLLAQFVKSGYTTKFVDTSTSNFVQEVVMTKIGGVGGGSASLTVTVLVSGTNQPVKDALVSLTNPLTGQSAFTFTSSNGKATFGNPPTGEKILVNVDKTGLEFASKIISLNIGESKSITIFTDTALAETITDRGCKDIINGVWLCNASNACTTNADCVSDICGVSGYCSTFNWTRCDDGGLERGNRCIIGETTKGTLRGMLKFSLANFFLVIVFIGLVILFLLIASGYAKIKPN